MMMFKKIIIYLMLEIHLDRLLGNGAPTQGAVGSLSFDDISAALLTTTQMAAFKHHCLGVLVTHNARAHLAQLQKPIFVFEMDMSHSNHCRSAESENNALG